MKLVDTQVAQGVNWATTAQSSKVEQEVLEGTQEVSKSTTQGLGECFPFSASLRTYNKSTMEIGWELLNYLFGHHSQGLWHLDHHSKRPTLCFAMAYHKFRYF